MELKTMNNERFNEFCNDMLAAYLDNDDPQASEFDPVLSKHAVDVESFEGNKILDQATTQVIAWISGEYSFDQLTEANQNRIISIEIANIVKDYGAVPGKDIQQTEYGLMVSPELLEKISANLPPDTVKGMETSGMISAQSPYELLEQDLGVPFFDSLQAVAKLRIQTLSDAQVSIYCAFFIDVERRHPWLESDDFFARFVAIVYGKRLYEKDGVTDNIVERMKVGTMALDDLLTALGRLDRKFDPVTGEMLLNRADLRVLDKVHLPEKGNWLDMANSLPEFDR
jgi:hypothetical protein